MKRILKLSALCLALLVTASAPLCACSGLYSETAGKYLKDEARFSAPNEAETEPGTPDGGASTPLPPPDNENTTASAPETDETAVTPEETMTGAPTESAGEEETPTTDRQPELPEPEFGTSEWVKWLIRDDGAHYRKLGSGQIYGAAWFGGMSDPDDTTNDLPFPRDLWQWIRDYGESDDTTNDLPFPRDLWKWNPDCDEPDDDLASPDLSRIFEIFGRGKSLLTEKPGADKPAYVWEIWYRDAGKGETEDFKSVTVPPCSFVDVPEWDAVICRLKALEAGLNDLTLETDGSDHEYEMVFVIYENGEKTPENVFGWQRTQIFYTASSEKYIQYALEHGVTDPA